MKLEETKCSKESEWKEGEEDVAIPPHDPTARCCAWCYSPNHGVQCPHCPRVYCTQHCLQKDYDYAHSFWCGKAGEKGVDFDVVPIPPNKGLGVVTRRTFRRGDAILVERPVLTTRNVPIHNNDGNDGNICRAAMALTPIDGDLQDKVDANGVSLSNAYGDDGIDHTAGCLSPFLGSITIVWETANTTLTKITEGCRYWWPTIPFPPIPKFVSPTYEKRTATKN